MDLRDHHILIMQRQHMINQTPKSQRSNALVDSGSGYLTVRDYKRPEGTPDAKEIVDLVGNLLTVEPTEKE